MKRHDMGTDEIISRFR